MEKIRQEKAKRRSSIKPQNEPTSDQIIMDKRKGEIKRFMEESKVRYRRYDFALQIHLIRTELN